MAYNRQKITSVIMEALQIRKSCGYEPWDPICIFDAVEKMGLELRFEKIVNMDGLYIKGGTPLIILSSLRTAGRQAFNCGHELGHHVLGHGVSVDINIPEKLYGTYSGNEEFFASCFSSFFLMPKAAVDRALNLRKINRNTCEAAELFRISGILGVGYSTLVNHLAYGLKCITQERANELLKTTPKKIKKDLLLGDETSNELILVDELWPNLPIDISVGDHLILPEKVVIEGEQIEAKSQHSKGIIAVAVAPGKGRVFIPGSDFAAYVRVSQKGFVGRNIYRHLEEELDE
jgi:Zn-dependent peptidase ImmA (M78 family)